MKAKWGRCPLLSNSKLSNMIWFYDYNHKQLDGPTSEVIDMGDVRAKFAAFNFNAIEINGHDMDEIDEAVQKANAETERPTCIVMQTNKGQGVPELVNMKLNHHIRLTDEQSELILHTLEQELNDLKEAK